MEFMLMSLVIWRITHLLSKEDGPFDIIYHLRKLAGAGLLGDLLDCFYCLSIWVSLPIAICIGATVKEILLLWMAGSGLACLLEKLTNKN